MKIKSKLEALARSVTWEEDPDTDGGYVAEVSPESLHDITAALRAAGYEVSDSRDEDGRVYVWACATPCECACGCDAIASTTDDAGADVCPDCASYYVDETGDVVCARVQTSEDPCRHCGTEILWGQIQTHPPGVANDIHGRCGCRDWMQTERGPGNWVLSELPQDEDSDDEEEDRS